MEDRRRPGRPAADDETIDADHVLSSALAVFAVQGYDAVSLRRLSAELGMGHTFLSDRFGYKEKLWQAAVEHAVSKSGPPVVEALRADAPDDLTRLVGAVRAMHRTAFDEAGLAALIDQESRQDTERLAYIYDLIRPVNDELRAIFERVVATGECRPMPWYMFYFLVTAPTSLYVQPPLAALLGRPGDAEDHELLSELVLGGLLA
ncbi:MAG: TetR/AcrR family transcriptional regulator [Brachybacterium sp.]|uniref:TetR/AcrR family transcriptional regulator n=1 Tax=Brachybacterium sp. TaxID=1891286 RepID=UPI002647660E|nr:helix-turn-helix domain-containing protein [Brachybacterium sp.]MDN5685650.1 TetR/AcrR family transcriptional regulator [Brachybacterium sp.]